jgi:hypothetical protein
MVNREELKMKEITSAGSTWRQASFNLPQRLLPALKRWVALGTISGNPTDIRRNW